MAIRRLCCAVLVMALAIPVAAFGQALSDVIGQRVVSLRFEVEGRPDPSPTRTAATRELPSRPRR